MMKKEGIQLIFWFACGAVLYPSIEVLYRGYSHYSMALAGGTCAVLLYRYNRLYAGVPHLLRAAVCASLITLVEFNFGVVFNLFLHMDVWDYTHLPFNLLGQVCLPFFFIWYGFSLLLMPLFEGHFDKTKKLWETNKESPVGS